jgi:hypothetical protein
VEPRRGRIGEQWQVICPWATSIQTGLLPSPRVPDDPVVSPPSIRRRERWQWREPCGVNEGNPCNADAYHGFNGLDRAVVDLAADFPLIVVVKSKNTGLVSTSKEGRGRSARYKSERRNHRFWPKCEVPTTLATSVC